MAVAILALGVLHLFENFAAANKNRAARDQLRVLILLLVLFIFCWWLTGNSWSDSGGRARASPAGRGEGRRGRADVGGGKGRVGGARTGVRARAHGRERQREGCEGEEIGRGAREEGVKAGARERALPR